MSIQGAMNQLIGTATGAIRDVKLLENLNVDKQEKIKRDNKIQSLKNQEQMLDTLYEGQKKVNSNTGHIIDTIKDLKDVDTYDDAAKAYNLGHSVRKIASEQQERANTISQQKDIAKQIYAETGNEEYLDKYNKLVTGSTNANYMAQQWSKDAKNIDNEISAGLSAYKDLINKYQQAHDITDNVLARKKFLEDRESDPQFDKYIRGAFKDSVTSYLERGGK